MAEMKLPASSELTAEQAVEMLELLKGITVLGEWVSGQDGRFYRWRLTSPRRCACYVQTDGNGWQVVGFGYLAKFPQISKAYETAGAAMSAVDALLAERSDVLAVGVSRTKGE